MPPKRPPRPNKPVRFWTESEFSGCFGVGSDLTVLLGRSWLGICRRFCRLSADRGRLRLRRRRDGRHAGRRRERGLIDPAPGTALQILDMGKASIAADQAERPTSRKAVHGSRRGGGTCQHCDRLLGNQDHARARGLGLLSVLTRRVRLFRLFNSFAGLFRRFVRCGCRFLRGWWSLGNGLSFYGRRRGDGGRRGRCNRNRRILLHFRLAKVLTRAQENAHDNEQAGHDKEGDPFRRKRAPFRQGLPRYF